MCAPVAPHDGSNSATYTHDASTGALVLTGKGAHVGLPKVNGGELSSADHKRMLLTPSHIP